MTDLIFIKYYKIMSKTKEKKRRRLGDRKDGRLIRTGDPMMRVATFIMPSRTGAQNFFQDGFSTEEIDAYIHKKRQEGYPDLGILHLVIAAYVRAVSQNPGVNRFIGGLNLYARDDIQVIMAVKKEMSVNAPETMIKFYFKPEDTLDDVYRQCTEKIQEYKNASDEENGFDKLVGLLAFMPRFLLRGMVGFLTWLDYHGWLPKFLTDLSPFHGSLVISSIASLGIPTIYHHLYDFGTVPLFIAFSTARHQDELGKDGSVKRTRYLDFTITTDERICDGHYYSVAWRELRFQLKNPHLLEVPPKEVVEDIE